MRHKFTRVNIVVNSVMLQMSVTGESVRVTLCGAPPEAAGLSVFATTSRADGQPCLSIDHHRRYEWTRRWLVHAVQVDDDDVQARCQGSRSRAQQTAIRDKETTKMELETKLRESELTVERLQGDRRWFSDREEAERQEKERERAEREEEKRRSDTELRSLRASLSALRDEYEDLKDSHSSLSRSTSQANASQRTQITQLTRQAEMLNEELRQAKSLAEERLRAMDELHSEFDELSTQSARPQEDQNMAVIREELHRQASYLRQLEASNTKLKAELSRNGNVELLREEKRTLERRVKGADELRQRVAELEGQVDAARKEREDWANKSVEIQSPGKTPVSVTQALSDLRLAHAQILEEVGAAKALLRTKEAEMDELQQRDAIALERIQELEGEVRAGEGRKQQVDLLEREVGFCKALVASFQAENETTTDAQVIQLETLLAEYKESNFKLVAELETRRGMVSKDELVNERVAKVALQAALEKAEAECAEHATRIDTLEQELFDLSGEIAGGRHVPPGVRVLTMKDNPAQEWIDIREEVVLRLRQENDALLQRIGDLESQVSTTTTTSPAPGAVPDGMVPRQSWELANQEKLELEGVVKQKEKRLLRLQEIFRGKSTEFREAIESILGVKLAFYPNGQVRVTSMFDLNASFVFSQEAGKMQLVAQGEGGPQDLQSMMEYWVGSEECIPGFVASLTLECYESSKRGQEDAE